MPSATKKIESKTATAAYEKIAKKLADNQGVAISSMFGMPSLKIKGKAFAGMWNDSMVFKLTGEDHKKALGLPGAKLFDPAGGRPMKEWVQVPEESAAKWGSLAEAALAYVAKSAK